MIMPVIEFALTCAGCLAAGWLTSVVSDNIEAKRRRKKMSAKFSHSHYKQSGADPIPAEPHESL